MSIHPGNSKRAFLTISHCHITSLAETQSALVGPGQSGEQLAVSFNGGDAIPAPYVSEGTLYAIGLMTALHQWPDVRTLLMDDLDRALHPEAQRAVVSVLRRLQSTSHPGLQIIATTHSPLLVDHLDVNEVRVLALDGNGHTVCRPLASHPEYAKWRGSTKPGEFWSFVGEKWVTEPQHSEAR